jgi:hypothetical protein
MKILLLLAHLVQGGDSVAKVALPLEEQVFRGVYSGSNLYVYNPGPENSQCITAIHVNGKPVETTAKSAIEIDLSGFRRDEVLEIRVLHHQGCQPKLLNPRALTSPHDFQFTYSALTETTFIWYTQGETTGSRYFLEVFRNNFWKVEKSLASRGSDEQPQTYSAEIGHLPGKNKYRIKYLDNTTGRFHYSRELEYTSEKTLARFALRNSQIEFSEPLAYEVLNSDHQSVLKGMGELVDCSQLPNGSYLVVFHGRSQRVDKLQGKLLTPPPPTPAASANKAQE